jgi:hypothetical protein
VPDQSAAVVASGDEQRTKGIVLHAMRAAVLDLFGEAGLSDVAARVSADCRAQTVVAPASPLAWLPERYLVEWHQASWDGPAKRDDHTFCKIVNRRLDFGFGRIRRALLGLVGPEGVIRRAGELWKHDHTHGTFVVESEGKSATGLLSDHAYCESPIARRALAETFRYIVQLSRGVKHAEEAHALQGKSVFIRITWQ